MNWIARSSQQLDRKLLWLSPYRDRCAYLATWVRAFLHSNSTCIALLFLFLLSVWAAFNWSLTVQRIVRYYNPLPVWDYWDVVRHIPKYRAFDLRVFWEQHNEHRIVFPEIIFAIDTIFLHGRQILPLAISFLCQFSTWLVLASTLASERSLLWAIRYSAILLAGIIIGWQGSALALGIPFLLNWTLTQFASVLALALLCRCKKTSRLIYLIGTIVCSTVATYSSANGMMLWPVILTAAVLLSVTRGYILALAMAAVTNVSLYFIGYRVTSSLDLSKLIRHPIYLLAFLASYVSMPFGLSKTGEFYLWAGFVNLALFVTLLAITARRRLLASAPSIVLFGYFAFTLLTALLTAAGRMNPNDVDFTAAKASRYVTMPLVNWAALVIALIWVAGMCRWKLPSPSIILLAVTVLLGLTFPKLRIWISGGDVFFAQQQAATLSVENGLFDPEMVRYLYPVPRFIKASVQRLRDEHLSVFYKGYSDSLGQPLISRFPQPSNERRLGGVTHILPVNGGLEIAGWMDGSRPERLVFVSESARIVGLGRKLPAGSPPDVRLSDIPGSLLWIGFINSSFESKSLSPYVIVGRKRVAAIGGPSAIPAAATER